MAGKRYKELLQDPRWQKKRLKVFKRDEFRCQLCWSDKNTLHAHHKYYKKGLAPWQYPMKALITICVKCHDIIKPRKGKYFVPESDAEKEYIEKTAIEQIVDDNVNREGFKRIKEILNR